MIQVLFSEQISPAPWKPWQLYHRSLVQSATAYREWLLQMSLLGRTTNLVSILVLDTSRKLDHPQNKHTFDRCIGTCLQLFEIGDLLLILRHVLTNILKSQNMYPEINRRHHV